MNAKSLSRRLAALSLLSVAVGVVACSADSLVNPDAARPVTLSIATRAATPLAAMKLPNGLSLDVTSGANGGIVVTNGGNTLEIDSVKVVFARVVLYKATDTACGDDEHNDAADAQCTELKSGPILVDFPLTPGAQTLFSVPAPLGTYAGMKLHVHNPSLGLSGPDVQAFVAAHPEFANKSIRVVGKFNGADFVWTGDPVALMEQAFVPPLEVSDANGLSLTLKVDVASWFTNAETGALLDPHTTYYPTIAANIAHSFHTFQDEDHHGDDDHQPGTAP
jgi:hypothetical protein